MDHDPPAMAGTGRVRACFTTRDGGVSAGVYAGLNLGAHVGDDLLHVASNRARLRQTPGVGQ